MRNQTCCFTGHRKLPSGALPAIRAGLEREIKAFLYRGGRYFGVGGALGFDTLAAQTVLDLKGEFPQIRLILVLACADQAKLWPREDVVRLGRIRAEADKTVVLAPAYTPGCMHARNYHLARHSALCICYMTREFGGTFHTVMCCKELGVQVVNLADSVGNY